MLLPIKFSPGRPALLLAQGIVEIAGCRPSTVDFIIYVCERTCGIPGHLQRWNQVLAGFRQKGFYLNCRPHSHLL